MTSGARVRVELLGPLVVRVAGVPAVTRGAKLRALVAMLGLAGGRTVSVGDLLDGVWGEDLPATARNTLQHHMGVLRRALTTHGAGDAIVYRDPGYALAAETDVAQFVTGAAQAARTAAGSPGAAAEAYTTVLNLWRGPALSDLQDFEFARARGVALEEHRLTCIEAWADAVLAAGKPETLIPPLQELVTENPTRERLWEQLMVALYRTGRQDAALSAYRTARAALDRELGVTPTARLTGLHQAILRHDPQLRPVSPLGPGPARHLTSTTLVRSELPHSPPVLLGPGGTRLALRGSPVVIGRQGDCDLILPDSQASRRHARVEPVPAGYALVDLGSTNGTCLNGVPLDGSSVLGDGDRIEIGHSVVRFQSPPTPVSALRHSPDPERHLLR